jgi:hypothetical protein
MEPSKEYSKNQRKGVLRDNSGKESGGNKSYLVERAFSNLALYLNRESKLYKWLTRNVTYSPRVAMLRLSQM